MLLSYVRPRLTLAPFIRNYYQFYTPVALNQPICAELGNIRFVLEGGGFITTAKSERIEMNPGDTFFLGPTMSAYKIEMRPRTRIVGVGLLPRSWTALLDAYAADATDIIFDLREVTGTHVREACEKIFDCKYVLDIFPILDDYFSSLMERQNRRRSAYPSIIENWITDPNNSELDVLIQSSDVSQRQTERLALRYFGASPKKLQRKYRTLRAADRMGAGAVNWRDAAGEGFYDQAHFIKEFKTFVGVTPRQFIGRRAALISTIQEMRRGQNTEFPLAFL